MRSLLLLQCRSMDASFGEPAMAGIVELMVESLLSPPDDAPIEPATSELDLSAECVAQSAGQCKCVLKCPSLSLKVCM